MGKLSGKVALVTGGGTGIGRGIAELFASEGAQVLIAARREDKLKDVAALNPDKISYVQMDLRSREQRHRALQTCLDRYGRLDILVNNTAHQTIVAFADQSEDDIDCMIETNLAGTANMCHRALPLLTESKGCIVNISSTAGRATWMPSMKLVSYAATKAGINQLTRTLAAELGPLGIRVNAVAPGATRAEYSTTTFAQEGAEEYLNSVTALGRVGEPIDVARVVLFLVSDDAAWVTGQVIDASGGLMIAAG
jgi:NAD(P)-dependent dehydrogenase (short-subunit alcohol dehydrogenase family)